MIIKKNKKGLSLLFACTYLLTTHAVQAKNSVYSVDILSNGLITLLVNTTKKEYRTGNQLNLKEGDKVCFVKGKGFITIEGGKRSLSLSHENHECKTLEKIVKVSSSFPQLSLKSSEGTVAGITRGAELSINKTRLSVEKGIYTSPLYPDKNGNLRIESDSWITSNSRLPIVLQLIDPKGYVVNHFTSHTKGKTSFVLPKPLLADKHGYTVTISNQRADVMLNSIFYLK